MQPTFQSLNPYASPLGMEGARPEEAGVGVWRDGALVVMHRQANLPPYCIKTGAETGYRSTITLDWTLPIDWSRRRGSLELPLSLESYERFVRWIWRVEVATILFFVAALSLVILHPAWPMFVYASFGWGSILALIAFWIAHDRRNRLVRVVKFHPDYLWIHGAEEPFLARLPEWVSRVA